MITGLGLCLSPPTRPNTWSFCIYLDLFSLIMSLIFGGLLIGLSSVFWLARSNRSYVCKISCQILMKRLPFWP